MATTRLMPLHTGKGRTVGQAISDIIDYTENPQKTDGGRLITSWLLFAAPPTPVNMKNTKNGTMITLKTVNLFGKFITSALLSNHILLLR